MIQENGVLFESALYTQDIFCKSFAFLTCHLQHSCSSSCGALIAPQGKAMLCLSSPLERSSRLAQLKSLAFLNAAHVDNFVYNWVDNRVDKQVDKLLLK